MVNYRAKNNNNIDHKQISFYFYDQILFKKNVLIRLKIYIKMFCFILFCIANSFREIRKYQNKINKFCFPFKWYKMKIAQQFNQQFLLNNISNNIQNLKKKKKMKFYILFAVYLVGLVASAPSKNA